MPPVAAPPGEARTASSKPVVSGDGVVVGSHADDEE